MRRQITQMKDRMEVRVGMQAQMVRGASDADGGDGRNAAAEV